MTNPLPTPDSEAPTPDFGDSPSSLFPDSSPPEEAGATEPSAASEDTSSTPARWTEATGAAEPIATPAPAPAAAAPPTPPAPAPKYQRGDVLIVPGHGGDYHAEVVHIYNSLEDAESRYEGSFRTILKAPRGKPSPDQFFYYCEAVNHTRTPKIGVAEQHVTGIKRRAGT